MGDCSQNGIPRRSGFNKPKEANVGKRTERSMDDIFRFVDQHQIAALLATVALMFLLRLIVRPK
jgi:hypothetical protein